MKLLMSSVAVLFSLGAVEPSSADDPVWHTDLKKARSIAREMKRPLFIVFR